MRYNSFTNSLRLTTYFTRCDLPPSKYFIIFRPRATLTVIILSAARGKDKFLIKQLSGCPRTPLPPPPRQHTQSTVYVCNPALLLSVLLYPSAVCEWFDAENEETLRRMNTSMHTMHTLRCSQSGTTFSFQCSAEAFRTKRIFSSFLFPSSSSLRAFSHLHMHMHELSSAYA